LAACVEAEAGNQGLEGKRLVADVILNRVDSPDFPDTIEGVITQPYHFTSYWNGMISKVSISDETFKAVSMELENRSYPSLLFFTAGAYSNYGTPWQQVGDHYFSTK
jgi:N-acetylmuramoyl-L-alanine amidase